MKNVFSNYGIFDNDIFAMTTDNESKSKDDRQSDYGVDVASMRADDLDKIMLKDILIKNNPSVLDIGCGSGGQSLRLVQSGAKVLGVDSYDFSSLFLKKSKENNLSENSLSFVSGNMKNLKSLLNGKVFDDCCVQRAIHYLTYEDAKHFLTELYKVVSSNLYISVTGIDSEIGCGYQDKTELIRDRFCYLDKVSAETFSMYKKEEFEELLITSGWKVEKSWVSAFGNIKVVCT